MMHMYNFLKHTTNNSRAIKLVIIFFFLLTFQVVIEVIN